MTTITARSYTLPGGGEYLARFMGHYENDVEGLRELRKAGVHTLLLGDPGCGKTALIKAAFPDAENELGHSKMQAWDMLWRPKPTEDGKIKFYPAATNRAVTLGKVLALDEAMRLSEDGFTPLFSAMDGSGIIVSGNHDETDLPVADGFCVFGASNPLVRGAFLPEAIASRFHILNVETSEDLLVRMKLDDRLLTIWQNLSMVDGGEGWRPSVRELIAAQKFINMGNMHHAAYALTGWRVPARDRETVVEAVGPVLGVRVTALGGVVK